MSSFRRKHERPSYLERDPLIVAEESERTIAQTERLAAITQGIVGYLDEWHNPSWREEQKANRLLVYRKNELDVGCVMYVKEEANNLERINFDKVESIRDDIRWVSIATHYIGDLSENTRFEFVSKDGVSHLLHYGSFESINTEDSQEGLRQLEELSRRLGDFCIYKAT